MANEQKDPKKDDAGDDFDPVKSDPKLKDAPPPPPPKGPPPAKGATAAATPAKKGPPAATSKAKVSANQLSAFEDRLTDLKEDLQGTGNAKLQAAAEKLDEALTWLHSVGAGEAPEEQE